MKLSNPFTKKKSLLKTFDNQILMFVCKTATLLSNLKSSTTTGRDLKATTSPLLPCLSLRVKRSECSLNLHQLTLGADPF